MDIATHSTLRGNPVTRISLTLWDLLLELRWLAQGRPAGKPVPPFLKRRRLAELARRHNFDTVVETGTFLGDTAHYLHSKGLSVITVEVDETLALYAKRRFSKVPSVSVLHGDSAKILGEVVRSLGKPALFWLDGHYSGGFTGKGVNETPIVAEINGILSYAHNGSVVVVDDIRCFGTMSDYPSLDEMRRLIEGGGGKNLYLEADALIFSMDRAASPI